jgi:hypothetical protein
VSAAGFGLLVLSLGAAAGIFAATVGWVTLSRERGRLRRPDDGAPPGSDDDSDDTHSKQHQP